MEFNNSTTEIGIVQEINRLCGSTDNTYSLKAKTARVNQALDRFFTLAFTADGTWEIDDANRTDLPIATTNITDGQYDYSIADELIVIHRLFVADSAGNYSEIPKVSTADWRSRNIFEQPSGNSGIPTRWILMGRSILLDPVPNYSVSPGLKVHFQRCAEQFESTDTTKEPGIPSTFHMYLARYAALPYCVEKRLKQKNDIAALVAEDERAITEFMANRSDVRPAQVVPRTRSAR